MYEILNITAETYQAHSIHTRERDWAETNCYVDIWIELLNAMGYQPEAALAFTLSIDFENDQWTFFKFPLSQLLELFGLDVQELAIWRPLIDHIEEQLSAGRPVLAEMDSFYLPDTHGMAYQLQHVKSTVAINHIDRKNKTMGYFHGQQYYSLDGDNFDQVLRLHETDPAFLPPYVEIVKSRSDFKLNPKQLLQHSLATLIYQLQLLPETNPFIRYKLRLEKDISWLLKENLEVFHQYSFATLRQFGACYELSTFYLNWLIEQGETGLTEAVTHLKNISSLAKIYQFQLARSISRNKNLDLTVIDQMSAHWDGAINILKNKYNP